MIIENEEYGGGGLHGDQRKNIVLCRGYHYKEGFQS